MALRTSTNYLRTEMFRFARKEHTMDKSRVPDLKTLMEKELDELCPLCCGDGKGENGRCETCDGSGRIILLPPKKAEQKKV